MPFEKIGQGKREEFRKQTTASRTRILIIIRTYKLPLWHVYVLWRVYTVDDFFNQESWGTMSKRSKKNLMLLKNAKRLLGEVRRHSPPPRSGIIMVIATGVPSIFDALGRRFSRWKIKLLSTPNSNESKMWIKRWFCRSNLFC